MAAILQDLVVGEFQQMAKPKDDKKSRFDIYLDKNYNKTASLMANGCKAAVVLVGNVVESLVAKNEDKDAIREGWTDGIKAMPDLAHSFGKNLGVAFQLVDDWLDFTQGVQQLGKPAAADLR